MGTGSIWEGVKALLWKELLLEWRNRYAFSSVLLYIVSTIFTCYISFNVKLGNVSPIVWNSVLWIILLFSAVNSTSKSFTQEASGRSIFYWQLVRPESIILSKILFNIIILMLMSFLGVFLYMVVMGNPIHTLGLFVLNIALGAVGFSASLTLISAIASKAANSATLMPVLGFPILLPMIMILVRISKNALDDLEQPWANSWDDLLTLSALNLIIIALSYLLFPYLWRN